MARPPYKLSCALVGHKADVRAVASFADGTLVSTSRDKTAVVWKPSGNGKDYVQAAVLKGHTNFVNAVCVINPCERIPQGLIVTGSNDNAIRIYVSDQVEPINTIKAHQNSVCKLRSGREEGTFLSCSWDQTAKLWDASDPTNPRVTYAGHAAAVWSVADLANGCVITAAADKLVIVWSRDGSVRHKLSGHTDCVRDIAPIKDDEFLTCANDATVRHWNATTATCLGSYCGHENYIYSITAADNGRIVFTSGEDRTLRVWYDSEMSQTITLPTLSVWCINLLPNGDIAAGSSDGVVRIFSAVPDRHADAQLLQRFEEEVAATQLNAQLELGGVTIKDLPDAKVLEQPGQKEGQTKIVNDGDAVRAYSWSQREQKWVKIGDVVGASGGTSATSGKRLHNGIEYDYVFSVDIQDGVPPLKLPYNKGQDPWHVAQKFLDDNGLSQFFLDQVARFIIKNAEQAPVLNTTSQYADPFTGGTRYIPETGSATNSTAERESTRTPTLSTSNTSVAPSYIPHTSYLKLAQANISTILDKLRELNAKQKDVCKVPDERIEAVGSLVNETASEQSRSEGISTLKVLLDWPNDTVFPALDVARLAVLGKEANDQLCTSELLEVVRRHVKPNSSASNQMLTFRLLANMFSHEKGEKLCLDCRDEILKAVLDLKSLGSKNNQVAVSTYILNLIVALNKYNDASGRTKCLNVIFSMLPRLNESEAVFRVLVGLGTILSATEDLEDRNRLIGAVKESEAALNVLRTMSDSAVPSNKLANCSKQIIDLIL